jgi:hypothetical protein
MKRVVFGLLTGVLFLTACGQAIVLPQQETPSETSSPFPTPTRTSLLCATPTASIMSLPTIPTFTPTFDVSTIVTVTPAPKAICPIIQENLTVELKSFDDYYPELITALNQGTSIQTVIAIFEKKIDKFYFPNKEILVHSKIRYELVDITNDGVPEILLPGSVSDQPNASNGPQELDTTHRVVSQRNGVQNETTQNLQRGIQNQSGVGVDCRKEKLIRSWS